MDGKQGQQNLQDHPPPYNAVIGAPYLAQGHPQYGYPNQQQVPYTATGYAPVTQQMPQGGVILAQPGTVPTQVVVANVIPNMAAQLPDHMIFNIFMTLFCCWPIGIFAIMKSMACRDAKYRGDVEQATRLSREARRLGYWTLGAGIVAVVLFVILMIIYLAVFIP